MNKILLTASVFVAIFFLACSTKNKCEQLQKHFLTYEDAVKKIKSTDFIIQEEANTSKSSWIKSASFYSCDGILGYFIMKTAEKEYLYAEMPYTIWTEFKNAGSFGNYYNRSIKHRYAYTLSK